MNICIGVTKMFGAFQPAGGIGVFGHLGFGGVGRAQPVPPHVLSLYVPVPSATGLH